MIQATQMRTAEQSRMADPLQQNAGGAMRQYDVGTGGVYFDAAARTDYPRMMYRKTKVEQLEEQTFDPAKGTRVSLVVNDFGAPGKPMLCETAIAATVDDAEAMAAEGWEVSPHAAHGLSDGIARTTSAKDDRIAELEAMLALREVSPDQLASAEPETVRRGPGRPPKQPSADG